MNGSKAPTWDLCPETKDKHTWVSLDLGKSWHCALCRRVTTDGGLLLRRILYILEEMYQDRSIMEHHLEKEEPK